MSLVTNPQHIRLAMLGMVEENGHPFSWSAIINGRYDAQIINTAGYPMISDYLAAQPGAALGLSGVEVTHIWCDQEEDAKKVAQSSGIPSVLTDPLDVIGRVDAVVIPTDKGEEHLERARPFVEAGLPVFIDKPLTIDRDHLNQFSAWHKAGKPICSTSAMRFAREFLDLRCRMDEVGQPRLISVTCAKSWERYGIHALEAMYGLLPRNGFRDVCNTGSPQANIVHIRHEQPVDTVIAVIHDMYGGFCHVTVYGTRGRIDARFTDSFNAFKSQLQAFVKYLRTGVETSDFQETVEQIRMIIAGLESRCDGGRRVAVSEIACPQTSS